MQPVFHPRTRRRFPLLLFMCVVACSRGRSPVQPSAPPSAGPSAPVAPALALLCPLPIATFVSQGESMVVEFSSPTSEGGTGAVEVSCQPKSGDTFPVGETTVACTGRDTTSQVAACSFGVTLDPPPPRTEVTNFLAFGDSLTEGRIFQSFSGRAGSPESYPYLLESELASRYRAQTIVVENAGVGGEDATVGRTRLRHLLDDGDAEVVMIMEGANDLNLLALTGRNERGFSTIRHAIDGMVRDAQARDVRVFLATLPPQRAGGSRADSPELVVPFNREIRNVASARRVPLVDVFAVVRADLSLIGPDGLHLTAAGYQRVAEELARVMEPDIEVRPSARRVAQPGTTSD